MATDVPRSELALRYAQAAQEYQCRLSGEPFGEATPQATQREIFLESLALVNAFLPKVHVFNELLVQYSRRGRKQLGQVVPDNMVVVHEGPVEAKGSYDVPAQPACPFWVLEDVSKESQRKDYEDNMEKYEHDLKVPYYLTFYPDNQELTLYHHTGRKYVTVQPNDQGRCAIPELEMEVAILDGWVRFWFRGELLPLPAELQRELNQWKQRAAEAEARAQEADRRAPEADWRTEEERQARLAAEEELARLRAQLQQPRKRPRNSSK
jgi:Uma2 family endonuclease